MKTNSLLTAMNPKLMLVVSRALAALRPSLIAFLAVNAQSFSGGSPTPISFCNLLFVGNMCAALTVLTWFGPKPIIHDLKTMPAKRLWGLFMNGCLAALLSTLIFMGLKDTMVTNAVLLGRLGPVIYALAGAVIFGKAIFKTEWIGFSLIFLGIVAIVLIGNNFQVNSGDIYILASTVVYALTSILGKFMLSAETPLCTVVFSRNFVSAVIFFIIAMTVFGPHHFMDAFSGQLWIVMSIYALIVIVLSQLLWYAALGQLDSRVVGKWTSLAPLFGVTYAFLLNRERPSEVQIIAFGVIMMGIWITTFGKKRLTQPEDRAITIKEMAVRGESAATIS